MDPDLEKDLARSFQWFLQKIFLPVFAVFAVVVSCWMVYIALQRLSLVTAVMPLGLIPFWCFLGSFWMALRTYDAAYGSGNSGPGWWEIFRSPAPSDLNELRLWKWTRRFVYSWLGIVGWIVVFAVILWLQAK